MTREQAADTIDGLFETWGAALLRFALRRTGSKELAEDLVQEVFLSLYRELLRDTPILDPKAWTLGVLRRQIAHRFRDFARHGEQQASMEDLEALAGAAEPAAPVESWIERVAGLAAGLSCREEEVLLLRLQSLKYREIGEQMGISPKSVATLLARALRKLEAANSRSGLGARERRVEIHVPKTLQ